MPTLEVQLWRHHHGHRLSREWSAAAGRTKAYYFSAANSGNKQKQKLDQDLNQYPHQCHYDWWSPHVQISPERKRAWSLAARLTPMPDLTPSAMLTPRAAAEFFAKIIFVTS
jgi:hypothetical protein